MARSFRTFILPIALALPHVYAHAQQYTMTEIPALSGQVSMLTSGINAQGDVTGWIPVGSGHEPFDFGSDPFLYAGGVSTDLGILPGFYANVGYGVNDSGAVVGASGLNGWAQGTIFPLGAYDNPIEIGPLPGANNSYGLAMNNLGEVAGMADAADGLLHAFVYTAGALKDLGVLPHGRYSKGMGINDLGTVTGVADTGDETHAIVYSNGKLTDLGTLPGGTASAGAAINHCNQMTGSSNSGSAESHAILIARGRMFDLGALPQLPRSYGNALNNYGDVVGAADNEDGVQHAFVYTQGAMRDLNELVAPRNTHWLLQNATGINDSGQISVTALATDNSGLTAGFLLTPVMGNNHRGEQSCGQISLPVQGQDPSKSGS